MRRGLIVVGLVCLMWAGQAEASMLSNALGKTWSYLFSPVNCVAELGKDLVGAGTKFVVCVLSNANPKNLLP